MKEEESFVPEHLAELFFRVLRIFYAVEPLRDNLNRVEKYRGNGASSAHPLLLRLTSPLEKADLYKPVKLVQAVLTRKRK